MPAFRQVRRQHLPPGRRASAQSVWQDDLSMVDIP